MKLRLMLITILCFSGTLFTLGGCGGAQKGYLRAEPIKDAVDDVTERHDDAVNKDEKLTEVEKRTYLRQSELLRNTVNAAAMVDEQGEEKKE